MRIPKACDRCRGSGYIIVLADWIDDLDQIEKMTAGVGFFREACSKCAGKGEIYEWRKSEK